VLEYEKGKDEICKNPNLSTEEKEKELTKLLLSLKLRRYCCKMRMMSYKDIVQFIQAVPSEE
jgi:DNA-directed RNA polymerase subunit N (RpoN/RPB10)